MGTVEHLRARPVPPSYPGSAETSPAVARKRSADEAAGPLHYATRKRRRKKGPAGSTAQASESDKSYSFSSANSHTSFDERTERTAKAVKSLLPHSPPPPGAPPSSSPGVGRHPHLLVAFGVLLLLSAAAAQLQQDPAAGAGVPASLTRHHGPLRPLSSMPHVKPALLRLYEQGVRQATQQQEVSSLFFIIIARTKMSKCVF